MPKFRKRPVVIEAIQFTDENALEINSMPEVDVYIAGPHSDQPVGSIEFASVKTLEGNTVASPGDWIVTGVNGEVYPCKSDIFDKTYDLVEGDNDG